MSINDIDNSFSYLFYGDPNTGKTYIAGSSCLVPEMCPILWFDVEKGALTLKSAFGKEHADKFIYERINTYQEISNQYAQLERGDPTGPYTDLQGNEHPWPKTVVIDNLTEVQKLAMARIMKIVKREDSSRDEEVPSPREWGKILIQMSVMVRSFRDLDMNTIFTCWAMSEEDKRGKKKTLPYMQGKMGPEIAGYLDYVGYLYTSTEDGKLVRKMLTDTFDGTLAKVRGEALPKPVVVSPTMEMIYKAVTTYDGE